MVEVGDRASQEGRHEAMPTTKEEEKHSRMVITRKQDVTTHQLSQLAKTTRDCRQWPEGPSGSCTDHESSQGTRRRKKCNGDNTYAEEIMVGMVTYPRLPICCNSSV